MTRRACRRWVPALLCLGASPLVWAQQSAGAGPAPAWWVAPRVSVMGTGSDNVRVGGAAGQADASLTLMPGVRVVANSQNVKGFADYSLSGIWRARTDAGESIRHTLNSQLQAELIERRAYLDLSATMARQTVSVLGQQAVSALQTTNQTETISGVFSPYLQFRLPHDVALTARYSATGVMTKTPRIADTLNQVVSVRATQAVGRGGSWALDASQQRMYYNGPQPEIESSSGTLRLNYRLDEHLQVYAQGGLERSNLSSLNQQTHGQSGWGFDWRPDTATRVAAGRSQRFFGDGHDVTVEQRWRRSVLRFSDSRTLALQPATAASASLGTLNDLLNVAFADTEPDPVARAQLVSSFLQSRGLAGDMVVRQSFLTTTANIQRQQALSWVVNWPRDTLAFTLRQSWSNRVQGRISDPADDFSVLSSIKTTGWSVVWGHRLTPRDSLNVSVSQQQVRGAGQVSLTNGTEVMLVGLSSQLSRQLSGALTLQRLRSRSNQLPYTENSLQGSLLYRF